MKIQSILIFFLVYTSISNGQSIGLKIGTELSNNKTINNSMGFGASINIDNFSDKYVILLHSEHFKKECSDCATGDDLTSYSKMEFGISTLRIIPIYNNIFFRVGPNINYNSIYANVRGRFATWIEPYKALFVGLGATTNLHFKKVFQLPINFDFFVSPNYLLRFKNYSQYNEYVKFLNILTFEIEVSYIFSK